MTEAQIVSAMKAMLEKTVPEGLMDPASQIEECHTISDTMQLAMLWEVPAAVYLGTMLRFVTGNAELIYEGDPLGSGNYWPFQWDKDEQDIIIYG